MTANQSMGHKYVSNVGERTIECIDPQVIATLRSDDFFPGKYIELNSMRSCWRIEFSS